MGGNDVYKNKLVKIFKAKKKCSKPWKVKS